MWLRFLGLPTPTLWQYCAAWKKLSGSVMMVLSAFIPMVYWGGVSRGDGDQEWKRLQRGRGFVEMVGYAPSILSRRCTPLSTGPATKRE